jgi:predicted DNA binding CopG/RHH family protein
VWHTAAPAGKEKQQAAVPGPNPIVKARVDPHLRARVSAAARASGLTESEVLRQALHRQLGQDEAEQPAEDTTSGSPTRMTIRLPHATLQGVKSSAGSAGMAPSRWVASLVQSHVSKTPVLTDAELLTLEAALRELAAIGRNINQIARALNQAHFETERVRLDYLSLLNESITATRDEVRALVRASREAWGAG